jgi:hypothetical protein
LIEGEHVLLSDGVELRDGLQAEEQQHQTARREQDENSLGEGLGQHADEQKNDPRTAKCRQHHEWSIDQRDSKIKDRRDAVDRTESGHHRRAQKNQRPRGDRERFEKLPAIHIQVSHWQRQQPLRLAAFE